MRNVVLVHPAISTTGFSLFTPRWLYVLAQATPKEFGDPVLVDETLEAFDPAIVKRGDLVGIGITSGNCCQGYRVLRQAKQRGAAVVVGGIHATIFPEEPLEIGADAVVTGNGDRIWSNVVRDAFAGRLKTLYAGGRLPGNELLPARWDLLDPRRYMFPTVQTVAGCPENCSFCSVWVTDGRTPRIRLGENIIAEANQLYSMGFRNLVFADDNFNPATRGRIEREPSAQKRRQFENIREQRLKLFDDYNREVPKNLFSLTQMTVEILSDPEYLAAARDKMRVRGTVIGVESFTHEGLQTVNKKWNPVGERMVQAIHDIQENGIFVLASIICGLESDTPQSIRTMREFATVSGALFAQFTLYQPLPGTKDYAELVADRNNLLKPGYDPRHRTRLLIDKFWLEPRSALDLVQLPQMNREDWLRETGLCWDRYYSVREIIRRLRSKVARDWPMAGKVTYFLASVVFKRVYAGNGLSADAENTVRRGWLTRVMLRAGVAVYGASFRHKRVPFSVKLGSSAAVRVSAD